MKASIASSLALLRHSRFPLSVFLASDVATPFLGFVDHLVRLYSHIVVEEFGEFLLCVKYIALSAVAQIWLRGAKVVQLSSERRLGLR